MNLPPLPEPQKVCWIGHELFTTAQMRAYGEACAAAEREACAAICEADECDFLARDIRARGEA